MPGQGQARPNITRTRTLTLTIGLKGTGPHRAQLVRVQKLERSLDILHSVHLPGMAGSWLVSGAVCPFKAELDRPVQIKVYWGWP